mgnify:CR=1 FL=1
MLTMPAFPTICLQRKQRKQLSRQRALPMKRPEQRKARNKLRKPKCSLLSSSHSLPALWYTTSSKQRLSISRVFSSKCRFTTYLLIARTSKISHVSKGLSEPPLIVRKAPRGLLFSPLPNTDRITSMMSGALAQRAIARRHGPNRTSHQLGSYRLLQMERRSHRRGSATLRTTCAKQMAKSPPGAY